jgi:membrane protease YdiL (CAAX protease family)
LKKLKLSPLEPIINAPAEVSLHCAKCNEVLLSDEKFCGYCGQEVAIQEGAVDDDAFTVIQPTLVYYFATLVLLSIYKFTELFPEGIEGLLAISVIDVVIVIVFWGYFFRDLRPLFSLRKLDLKIMLFTVGGAFAGAVMISRLAELINISLFDDVYYSPYSFEDTSQPFLWAIIMTCLQPAIFEEVAFRGFMFTNLQVLSSPRGAVYISAILFGVMHLSFISLLWLVPLGIIFAMMRLRYNTLWYGIIGHFIYNLTITVIEFNF